MKKYIYFNKIKKNIYFLKLNFKSPMKRIGLDGDYKTE